MSSQNWGDQQSFLALPAARVRGASIGSEVETITGPDAINRSHNEQTILSDDDAIRPDPGTDADFACENNLFTFTPGRLWKFLKPKSQGAYHALGGLAGVEKNLQKVPGTSPSRDEQRSQGKVSFDDVFDDGTPSSLHMTTEELSADLKKIYGNLANIEAKCITLDAAQAVEKRSPLSNEQWQTRIALHRTLLYDYQDYFKATWCDGPARIYHEWPLDFSESSKYERTERIAQGSIASSSVEAFVDTCAGNFVSASYLHNRRIPFDSKHHTKIRRADGSSFSTLGRVELPWRFRNDKEVHKLIFDVVPDSHTGAYPLVLGSKFMHMTKTLSHFAHRIISKTRDLRFPRVMYQGASQLRMMGYCDGIKVATLPDTGSDADLISPLMAEELRCTGAEVLMGPEHSIALELPGGIVTRTLGVVRNVDFRFGDGRLTDRYIRDFHILSGLPAGVLLSDNLLSEANAFQRYHEHMIEVDTGEADFDMDGLFLNIRYIYDNPGLLGKTKAFLGRLRKRGEFSCPRYIPDRKNDR
jgi:hypothetical protein